MTTPVLADSFVIFANSSQSSKLVALRISDGAQVWHSSLPGTSPMGNPIVIDSILYLGLEGTSLCAIRIRDGSRKFCVKLDKEGWGAGHTSVSAGAGVAFIVTDKGVATLRALLLATQQGGWAFWMNRLFGVDLGDKNRRLVGEQVLSAVDANSGAVLWTQSLGAGTYQPAGHIAAVAVIESNVVYASSPISGRVAAYDTRDGAPLWSRDLRVKRGNVLVLGDRLLVFAAARSFVVLSKESGRTICVGHLPAEIDRSGATVANGSVIAGFVDGLVISATVHQWLECAVPW